LSYAPLLPPLLLLAPLVVVDVVDVVAPVSFVVVVSTAALLLLLLLLLSIDMAFGFEFDNDDGDGDGDDDDDGDDVDTMSGKSEANNLELFVDVDDSLFAAVCNQSNKTKKITIKIIEGIVFFRFTSDCVEVALDGEIFSSVEADAFELEFCVCAAAAAAVVVDVVVAVVAVDVDEMLCETAPVGGVGKSKARLCVASFCSPVVLAPPPKPPAAPVAADAVAGVVDVLDVADVLVAVVSVVICACIVSRTTFDDKIDSRIGCSSQ
jgi:hypothetical protein